MLVTLVISVQIAKCAVDSITFACPGTHLHRLHVFDVYAANQWNALPPTPLFIRIHSHESGLLFGV
jgi:hypothetical protein